MSHNDAVQVENICTKCVHEEVQFNSSMLFCKLLEETLIKGKLECEDWEAKNLRETSVYECD